MRTSYLEWTIEIRATTSRGRWITSPYIYSQSLSASDINSLYNAEVGAPTPAPIPRGSGSTSSDGCDMNCIIGVSTVGSVVAVVLGCVLLYYKFMYPESCGNRTLVPPDEPAVPPIAQETPHEYICPITTEIMVDPVSTDLGFTYTEIF